MSEVVVVARYGPPMGRARSRRIVAALEGHGA